MYNSSCSHGWKMHKSVWLPTIRLFRLFKSPVWTNGDIIKELCVKITLDFYFIDVLRRLIWQLDQLVSEVVLVWPKKCMKFQSAVRSHMLA